MKWFLAVCVGFLAVSVGRADDGTICIERVKTYLAAQFAGSTNTVAHLAADVNLLGGHEVLKKEYGVSDSGRGKPVTVPREKLLAGWKKMIETMAPEKKKEAEDYLTHLAFRAYTSDGSGNFLAKDDPAYPKLKRETVPAAVGDIIVFGKAGTQSDDFILFVLRKIDGEFRIVVEYID